VLELFCGFGGVAALAKAGKRIANATPTQVECTNNKLKFII
jgi:hypothetical protein